MATTYEAIQTTTLGSAAADITFSSIPATYTDLVLVYIGATVSNNINYYLRLNGDTGTNYSYTYLSGTGSAVGSGRGSTTAFLYIAQNSSSSGPDIHIAQLQNYANTTTYKTVLDRWNEPTGNVGATVGLWRSTSAITSVLLAANGSNIAAGSTCTLYGILAA